MTRGWGRSAARSPTMHGRGWPSACSPLGHPAARDPGPGLGPHRARRLAGDRAAAGLGEPRGLGAGPSHGGADPTVGHAPADTPDLSTPSPGELWGVPRVWHGPDD